MATVKLVLDTRSTTKEGTHPVKLSLSHNRAVSYLKTNIFVTSEQWSNQQVIDHPKSENYNKVLKSRYIQAENHIITLSSANILQTLSHEDLKAKIENKAAKKENIKPYLITDHFLKYIEKAKKPKTAEIYRETMNKIKSFQPNTTFKDMNKSWLESFEVFLSPTCKTNTRGIHLRNIRAVFNDAIDNNLIDKNSYPFRKFKIEKEKTRKRALTVEQLKLLRDYQVQPHQERYRDMFMLSFYLIGINMVDLLNLKHSDLINGRIEYTRAKTYRLYSIEVLPEAMALIEKYKGENYLLNIMDTYSNYKDFMSRMDENLKEIGKLEWAPNRAKDPKFRKKNVKKITPLFPKLSTYWARHTWATIAANKGCKISLDDIALCLGHGEETDTKIYIDFNLDIIDEANRKVLEFIRADK
jgi:hypothetical protein